MWAEAGTRAAAPFPAPLSPLLAASFLRCAPDRFLLTKPNTSCTMKMPASLRSDSVRVHSGMPFGIVSNLTFGFAGIPNSVRDRICFRIPTLQKSIAKMRRTFRICADATKQTLSAFCWCAGRAWRPHTRLDCALVLVIYGSVPFGGSRTRVLM
jgi:hypothetical protein